VSRAGSEVETGRDQDGNGRVGKTEASSVGSWVLGHVVCSRRVFVATAVGLGNRSDDVPLTAAVAPSVLDTDTDRLLE